MNLHAPLPQFPGPFHNVIQDIRSKPGLAEPVLNIVGRQNCHDMNRNRGNHKRFQRSEQRSRHPVNGMQTRQPGNQVERSPPIPRASFTRKNSSAKERAFAI